ncbi:hypothetical protein F53441_8421 [Fusarium austroafricanum]|uniref:UBX domain-containing protein 2 n=1 Tax=Fusarium austroafricanum TaxID=2364996 RepID=A0A8H4KBC3_9HYPO|nr:hypothetical protein F53441_8421 [Fusarium austroafricanum]
MFYEGTLQDGISTAVGQQKLVLCFVTDESDESTQWETEFLTDDTLSDLLKEHAIALRLKAGSEEAGYLAQIFPLPRTPTVVIIKNGELKEYITPGTSKEDFLRRVQTAFNSTSAAPASTQSAPEPAPAQASPQQSHPETPAAPEQNTATAPSSSTSENVRRILAERAARLQAQKEENERKVREERARMKEKAKAEAEAGMDTDNARAHKAAEAVRKKRQQDQEERARILKRIEDDKAERRLRAEEREKQRIDSLKVGDVASSLVNAPETKLATSKTGAITALQVRLFDGSTVRSRFKTTAHLKEVRQWVDENRTDGSQPYTFKQVLTPLPNKNIDETEEDKALGELGLSPSSTLVLIPIKKFTNAYDDSQGIVSKVIGFILSIFTWIFSLFGAGDERAGHRGAANDAPASSQERVQSFQNHRDQQRDQQLYNGNSLNFEPRPEEEEKDN